ncbi:MAG: DUF1343 domain-containing protein, partial [Bacteroidetes bacterium]|nr:DUF1343 domain-containing protein [Bacteroidota bacterium]
MKNRLQLGIDVLLQQPAHWHKLRTGLVTNDAATTIDGQPGRIALLKKQYNITKLFAPEHGIKREGEDGAFQHGGVDALTGLPIVSLYGTKLAPDENDLADIDLLLLDLPDIGCRFYTYLWTMTHVMEACAAFGKTLVIADRPNPIGADLEKAEGPWLDEMNCASFTGRWNIPLKHSCTLAELAGYFNTAKKMKLRLQVQAMQGYRRSFIAGYDFPFTASSPAISTAATALFYPGTGLLEGINVNEGRGSLAPFLICGAPWMNDEAVKEEMMQEAEGYYCDTLNYIPAAGMYAGIPCRGIQFHLTDPASLMAVHTGIRLLQTIIQLHPQQVTERLYTTVANPSGQQHLDRLLGIANAFQELKEGNHISTHLHKQWKETIEPYLLY